eukprot:g9383.t1
MAEVVGTAVTILQVLAEIRDAADGIRENDQQALRLTQRVTAIEPTVLRVKNGNKRISSKSLGLLLETLKQIKKFLKNYKRMTLFDRVWKRRSNADSFKGFSDSLVTWVSFFNLDVAVDGWTAEDASDQLEDIESLRKSMKGKERSSSVGRAECTRAVKELDGDERRELKKLSAWVEIDFDNDLDFEGSIRLGSGGFGEVITAKWNGSDVAVKYLREDDNRDLVRAIRKEIRTHASLHFDYVVPLYAASTIAPNLCMVMEYASEGSLWKYLHENRDPLGHPLQAAFLFDIARGMSFLHSKDILHRDLKSANVLLFANRRLKLCDFGLCKIKTESSSGSSRRDVGTSQWMSPEEMNGSSATELTDVYSFGIVCFEVATRMEPFKGRRPLQVMQAVLFKKERPQIPQGASGSPDVLRLMERCWQQEPAQRPQGFVPVVEELAIVVKRLGDPRIASSAAQHITSSTGGKGSGTTSDAASTAPLTVRDSYGASRHRGMPVEKPVAAASPPPAPPSQDSRTDRAALMALYVATNGPPEESASFGLVKTGGWHKREGWGTSRPMGEWHGVTVDGRGRVIKLELAENNLRGPIPQELGRLAALTELDLSWNNLSGPIPQELGSLTALMELDLSLVQLSGPIPQELGRLTALTRLSLHSNKLKGPIPQELGRLTALTELALGSNKLNGPIPQELGRLTALTLLGLYSNKLSGPIPQELGRLTALTELGLRFNKLSGPIPEELGRLTALTHLYLESNQLSQSDKEDVRRMLPNCRYLHV